MYSLLQNVFSELPHSWTQVGGCMGVLQFPATRAGADGGLCMVWTDMEHSLCLQ